MVGVAAGSATAVLIGLLVVTGGSDGPGSDVRVGTGEEQTDSTDPIVPEGQDAFAVDDSLARRMVTGVDERFVVVRGGRRPSLSVLDASGRLLSEAAIPVAEGTGLGRAQARATSGGRVLVTGVQCSTVREDADAGVLCDPGVAFVGTLALDSQEWVVAPGTIDPGPTQDLVPLGVATDGRAVVQAYEEVRTVDLSSGVVDPLPPGGGPTEGSGVRCLIDDVVVRGDTFSTPAMQPPEPGEPMPTGDEPFPPFGASTFDLATGEWDTFVPAPDELPYEDSSYHLRCAGEEVIALPGQPSTAQGEPLDAYRFATASRRWQPFPAPPFEEPSAWINADAPSADVVAVITTSPDVGGYVLSADGRWRRFVVDVDGAEPRQAAATATHVAILTQQDTLVVGALG
jgi:hypothetical protein